MKKTISIITLCALVLSVSGCAKGETSEPVVTTTAPIYVQEDDYQTTAATEITEPTVESEESKPEEKPAPDTKDNEFNLDGIYNSTIENNLDDDVYFEVYIEYAKDNGEVVSETITLDDSTSYDDLANKLAAFGLVTTDATREISYGEDYEWSDYAFEYKGIGHNISLAPETETALYLELVDDKGIVTDASLLGNGAYNPSVKAISSKLFTDSWIVDDEKNLIHKIPVTVIFKIYVSDNMMLEYEDWQKEKLNEDGAYEVKVGMSKARFNDMFDTENIGMCYIIKNADYTFAIYVDDSFNSYIGDVILIKN